MLAFTTSLEEGLIGPIPPSALLIFLSALVVGGISLLAYRRDTRGSRLFSLLTLVVMFYALTYGFELLSSSLESMLFWIKLEYLSIVLIPLLLLFFTLVYTGHDHWLTSRSVILAFVLPVIILLLVWTNEWHGLYYTAANVIEVNGFPRIETTVGFPYWINVFYSYLLLVASFILLVRFYRATTTLYRWQIRFILAGVLIPWIGDALYIFLFRFRGGIDLAPVTFTLSGVLIAAGLFRYRLLDLMPVARSKLVETMQDAWIVLDAKNRFVDLNSSAQTFFQRPKNQLIGVKMEALLPQGHPLLGCLALETDRRMEIDMSTPSSPDLTYEVRLSLLRDQQQQTNGRLLVLHNVTDRKMAEDALRAMNKRLESTVEARTEEIRSEKEKVETILQTIKEGIVLTGPQLTIEYANAGMLHLTRMTEAALLDRPLDALPVWEDESIWGRVQVALREGESWEGEIELRPENGRLTTYALVVMPIFDGPGPIVGTIATFHDITDLKKLHDARHQLIANISHELRTPLSNLTLYLDLLDRTPLSERGHRYISALQNQTKRMENLAQGVVDLAMLDSRHRAANRQPISPNDLIQEAFEAHESLIKTRDLKLVTTQSVSALPELEGDPEWLQQAVGELIDNAATFSEEGGEIRLMVDEVFEDGRQWVTITVADDGPGIAPAEQERIFERFYRGSAVSQGPIPGLGLGLSIVWKIMEVHDGRVTVSSEVGEGSAFTLWLPAVREGAVAAGRFPGNLEMRFLS